MGHADPTLALSTNAHLWRHDDDRWADVFDTVIATRLSRTSYRCGASGDRVTR